MPVEVPAPDGLCFRISYHPPLVFPDDKFVGTGRFDDPLRPRAYRLLYTGVRVAAFVETLAKYRKSQIDLPGPKQIPRSWFTSRRIGTLSFGAGGQTQRWLDLTSPDTFHLLESAFASLLAARKIPDFDASIALGNDRALTQTIGRWAHERGFHGIQYATRWSPTDRCWAIFEGTEFVVVDEGTAIERNDPDLIRVAKAFALTIPPL